MHAAKWGAADHARAAALLHDLGKYADAFEARLAGGPPVELGRVEGPIVGMMVVADGSLMVRTRRETWRRDRTGRMVRTCWPSTTRFGNTLMCVPPTSSTSRARSAP